MYKKFTSLIILTVFFFGSANATLSRIDSLDKDVVSKSKCDETLEDTWYYMWKDKWEFKVFWYHFKNEWVKDIYLHNWKTVIMSWFDLTQFNTTITEVFSDDKLLYSGQDLFVFNRPYLLPKTYKIAPKEEVRVLTTAEEHGKFEYWWKIYNTYFKYWDWQFVAWSIVDNKNNILPDNKKFENPILKIVDVPSSPTTDKKKYDVFFKFAVLFDNDNNLKSLTDNQAKTICYGMKIRWCGDGIVDPDYGEECDPKVDNDCSRECTISWADNDNDGVSDNNDYCPDLPESKNGIEDQDGCPEIIQSSTKFNFSVENCNQCPCHWADWKAQILPWDIINAVLINPYQKDIIYSISDTKEAK